MKLFSRSIVVFLMLNWLTFAQSQTAPATTSANADASNAARIAPGSVIPVQLTKGIDAKKAKTGDAVEAKVTTDLKSNSGEIIIAKDTRVTGRVTDVQSRSKGQKESHVAIFFEHAISKSGDQMALPMSIQAIIAPEYFRGNNTGSGSSESASQSPSVPNAGTSPGGNNSRSGGMGATQPQQSPSTVAGANNADNSQAGAPTHPAITGDTKGVLGIDNLSLSTASDAKQGSILSSEKNNVKLEGGTLMLLRVDQ